MLINLRNAMMAGKRWKNPYVTDGLVAMWDGEWNAGGGVHNANTSYPVDLTGNIVSPTLEGSAFPCGDNYFDFGSGNLGFTYPDFVNAVYTGTATFEIVCYPNGTRIGDAGFITVGVDTANRGLWIWQNTANFFPRSTYRGGQLNLERNDGGIYQIVMDGSKQRVYRNGVNFATGNVGTATKTNDRIYLGKLTNRPNARVYCVRLYTRALTTVELAANRAVDIQRFPIT